MEMKKAIILIALLGFVLTGFSKGIKDPALDAGIIIKYTNSVGKTLPFKNESDAIQDVSDKGNTQSTHQKSVTKLDITCDSTSDSSTTMTYKWKEEESGSFVNGQYQKSEEENEIIGQSLTITINAADGKLKKWDGLEDLTFDEAGMNQAENMANEFASFIFEYFPPTPVKKGSKWDVANATQTSREDGGFVKDNRVKSYELVGFEEKDGHKCAKCKITIKIDANTQSTGKDKEGTEYEVTSTGMGEGSGTLFFDYEKGCVVNSNYDWIIDLSINSVNMTTSEKQEFKLYQESHEKYELEDSK